MSRVKIITHTSCDLSGELAEKYRIKIIPDVIFCDGKVYYDGVDLKPDEFYQQIDTFTKFPSSGHPSPEEFMEAFRECGDYDELICIVISTGVSGTIDTAKLAAKLLAEEGFAPKIHVFDSYQVSYGMGLLVLEAAQMALDGADAQTILQCLHALVPRVGVYFVMRTLKYAKLGGRVGAIKALAADALGVKPLLTIKNGTVSDPTLNRTFQGAVNAVVKRYVRLVGEDKRLFIFHANNPQGAAELEAAIRKEIPEIQPSIERVGPVVGLYTGVGCLGIAFLEKEP